MDREPRCGRRRAHEACELHAAHAIRANLANCDPAALELLRDEVGGVAQAAARDELALGVFPSSGWELDVGLGERGRARDGETGENEQPHGEQSITSTMRIPMMLLALSLGAGACKKDKEAG